MEMWAGYKMRLTIYEGKEVKLKNSRGDIDGDSQET